MKIERMTKGEWKQIRAYFDLNVDGIIIKGFKLIIGTHGMFVGPPSKPDKDGDWKHTVYIEKHKLEKILELAQKEYEKNMSNPLEDILGGV